MAEMKLKKDKKGNVTSVTLKGVHLFYTNIRRPKAIYDDRKLPYEKARKEYSVDIAVTEDVADEWDELFGKQPSKKHTNKSFREKYKIDDDGDIPYPKEKKQYTLKVTQKAEKKNGDPISDKMIPRVFVKEGEKPTDITFDTNVGNMSVGNVLIRVNQNDYGNFAYLNKILVTDLIEYEDRVMSEDEEEFLGTDDVEFAEAPERKGASPSKGDDDDDDDDVPDFDDGEEIDEDY